MPYLDLFCVSVSKMCPAVSEKSERAHKGITLSVKLDIIKHIWYNLVGYLGVCGKAQK